MTTSRTGAVSLDLSKNNSTTRIVIFSVLSLVVLISSGVASSESSGGAHVERARELYRRAVSQFDTGNLDTALQAFRESYELHPHSETEYNIACVLSRLGSYREAIAVYEHYLSNDDAIHPSRRAQIDSELQRLRRSLGGVLVRVIPSGAIVMIDGEEVATSSEDRPIPVDPGRHLVQAQLEGYEEGRAEVSIAPSETATVDLALRPLPARIVITDAPSGTIIEIDGARFGVTPFENPIEVFAGRHVIRANIEGYEVSERTVDALPGADLRVGITPGRALPYARLRFDGDEEATVLIDGEPVGTLPWEGEIASGERLLAIEGEGLNRWEGTVTVRRGDLLQADVRLGESPSGPGLGWFWSLAGLAVAAGAVALGFGLGALEAQSVHDTYAQRIQARAYDGRNHLADLQDLAETAADDARAYSVVCDVSWGFAVTSALAAVLMLALRDPGDAGPSVEISPVDDPQDLAGDGP